MALPKFDIGGLFLEGMKVAPLTFKAPEDADVKTARLRQEKWSFFVKELGAHITSFLFLIVIGAYCCFVVAYHGVVSQEARAVFPRITTLFGGVEGIIVGKAGK